MSNRTAFASWITAAVLAIAVLAAPGAQAVLLYSVDVGNDRLMLLDSVTGAVTDIGPLGDNALDIDLALISEPNQPVGSDAIQC